MSVDGGQVDRSGPSGLSGPSGVQWTDWLRRAGREAATSGPEDRNSLSAFVFSCGGA